MALVVTVVAPNGGESWPIRTTQNLSWTIAGGTAPYEVKAELSIDGGVSYVAVIADAVPQAAAGAGSTPWTLSPNVRSTSTARVRITVEDDAGATASDVSDANFTIVGDPEIPEDRTKYRGLLAVRRDGKAVRVLADEEGKILGTFEAQDIEIGTVKIEDGNTNRKLDIVTRPDGKNAAAVDLTTGMGDLNASDISATNKSAGVTGDPLSLIDKSLGTTCSFAAANDWVEYTFRSPMAFQVGALDGDDMSGSGKWLATATLPDGSTAAFYFTDGQLFAPVLRHITKLRITYKGAAINQVLRELSVAKFVSVYAMGEQVGTVLTTRDYANGTGVAGQTVTLQHDPQGIPLRVTYINAAGEVVEVEEGVGATQYTLLGRVITFGVGVTIPAGTGNVEVIYPYALPGRSAGAPIFVNIVGGVGNDLRKLRSDKDTHFTGAIAQNASEQENIAGLAVNKITIENVVIQSDQALHYELWVFAKDTFANADLDLDTRIGVIDLDLTALGITYPGQAQFSASFTKLELGYEDEDATLELHCALVNRSAAAKNAGATGEVVVEVRYRPRS